jgi:hypothetical protein
VSLLTTANETQGTAAQITHANKKKEDYVTINLHNAHRICVYPIAHFRCFLVCVFVSLFVSFSLYFWGFCFPIFVDIVSPFWVCLFFLFFFFLDLSFSCTHRRTPGGDLRAQLPHPRPLNGG